MNLWEQQTSRLSWLAGPSCDAKVRAVLTRSARVPDGIYCMTMYCGSACGVESTTWSGGGGRHRQESGGGRRSMAKATDFSTRRSPSKHSKVWGASKARSHHAVEWHNVRVSASLQELTLLRETGQPAVRVGSR